MKFDSYTPTELGEIGQFIARKRDSEVSEEALALLVAACAELYEKESTDQSGQPRRGIDLAGNGRFIRNVIEAAEEEREFRLASDESLDLATLDESVLMRIEAEDMRNALTNVLSTIGR